MDPQTDTPNLDKLIEEWQDHHPEDRIWLRIFKGPRGYLAEVRLGNQHNSAPAFHPEDGERCLSGTGASPTEALEALDALCAPLPPERWAFWPYDLFPFTLGGLIEGPATREGHYRIKGYGAYVFEPFVIVEGRAGARLKADLDAIRDEYSKECAKLRRGFLTRWRVRLAQDGVVHPNEVRWSAEARP